MYANRTLEELQDEAVSLNSEIKVLEDESFYLSDSLLRMENKTLIANKRRARKQIERDIETLIIYGKVTT